MYVFDDYSLPSNYGYGEGDASQLSDLSHGDAVAGVSGYGQYDARTQAPPPVPERPRMRVVPNPGEQGYARPSEVPSRDGGYHDDSMSQYGYGAELSDVSLAVQQAKALDEVTPQSSPELIRNFQSALVRKGDTAITSALGKAGADGIWATNTTKALRILQSRAGLAAIDKVDGPTWAALLVVPANERAAVQAYSQGGGGKDKFFSASGITAGLEGLLSAIKPPAPNAQFQAGAQTVSNDKTEQQGGGSDWKTYALIAGGVLLVGGAVYLMTRSKED